MHKTILKQCKNLSKSKKLFRYHPVQSEKNKHIAGNIASTLETLPVQTGEQNKQQNSVDQCFF